MRRACIDIGSNTTRLLVADCDRERLEEIHQERAFTHTRRGLMPDGPLAPAKMAEVTEVVAAQARRARELGAVEIHGVATAAIRQARNGGALVAAIREACGVEIRIVSPEDEARLAFLGAARSLGDPPRGQLGVVDVGGGSSELVVGTIPDRVSWYASFEVGSGELADVCLRSDPPSDRELSRARALIAMALDGVVVPRPAVAVAVGGSAASLQRLAGPLLDAEAFALSLALLRADRASEIARRFGLDVERVRLLPAGLLILQGAWELFGAPLRLGCGGLREGVLLEHAGV